MKDYKAYLNPHSQQNPETESDANLFGFFALLYKVDLRDKQRDKKAGEIKKETMENK